MFYNSRGIERFSSRPAFKEIVSNLTIQDAEDMEVLLRLGYPPADVILIKGKTDKDTAVCAGAIAAALARDLGYIKCGKVQDSRFGRVIARSLYRKEDIKC